MTPEAADVIIPLDSRRVQRAKAMQKMQHAVPAGTLFYHGVHAMGSGASGIEFLLAIAEIATSSVVLVSMFKGIRRRISKQPAPAHAHHGVDIPELWMAAMLFAEVWSHWHHTHHIIRPTLLLAVMTLILGLFHGRISALTRQRRALRITSEGVSVGARKLWLPKFVSSWDQLASIDVTDTEVLLRDKSGKSRKIDLSDLENAAEVKDALTGARARLLG